MATPELVNTNLQQLVAAAADLCRKPLRHAVLPLGDEPTPQECCLRLEARSSDGVRCEPEDLELEIFRSGNALNLSLAWCHDPSRPLLWHGSHPVWMDAETGLRCERPRDGREMTIDERHHRNAAKPTKLRVDRQRFRTRSRFGLLGK